jgi:hypothetical protein
MLARLQVVATSPLFVLAIDLRMGVALVGEFRCQWWPRFFDLAGDFHLPASGQTQCSRPGAREAWCRAHPESRALGTRLDRLRATLPYGVLHNREPRGPTQ